MSLKKLLDKAAGLTLTEPETATLASRLAKLELELTVPERTELDAVAGHPVRNVIREMVDAVDPDVQAKHVEAHPSVEPVDTIQALLDAAVEPIAANPDLRNRILELRATHDRTIDEVSRDTLIDAHGVVDTTRAKSVVESWRAYLGEHRAEITAIQLLAEARDRRVSFHDIQELADRIARPPHNWTPDLIWNAYVAIEAPNVRRSPAHTLTDLVSLVRYTVGADDELVPYADLVRERYAAWLVQQEHAGVTFTEAERWWLDRMVSVVASSAGINSADLDDAPFTERGGTDGAVRDLGDRAARLIDELNAELTA